MSKEKMFLIVDKVNSCSDCELAHCTKRIFTGKFSRKSEQCPLQDTTELLIAVCRLHSRAEQLFKHRPQDNTFGNEEQNGVLRDKLYKALGGIE